MRYGGWISAKLLEASLAYAVHLSSCKAMELSAAETGLPKDSVAVTPQITVIDRARLLERVSVLPDYIMRECTENIKLLLDVK